MASIPADALMDEEIVVARDLKRRSLTLSELAKPAEKHAKFNPQSHMCEDTSKEMESSESKAVGATSEEELMPIDMPKEYKKSNYIDRVSGDVLLHNPTPGRKQYTFLDGNFLVVDCELYDRKVLLDKILCGVLNKPYEGSECEGKTVIDLIEMNNLISLPPPPSDEDLRKYLNYYMDCLDKKVNGAKEMPDREKVTEYLVSHRKEIDFFMGINACSEGMQGSVVCAHYKKGRTEAPTLMYIKHGLKIEKR